MAINDEKIKALMKELTLLSSKKEKTAILRFQRLLSQIFAEINDVPIVKTFDEDQENWEVWLADIFERYPSGQMTLTRNWELPDLIQQIKSLVFFLYKKIGDEFDETEAIDLGFRLFHEVTPGKSVITILNLPFFDRTNFEDFYKLNDAFFPYFEETINDILYQGHN